MGRFRRFARGQTQPVNRGHVGRRGRIRGGGGAEEEPRKRGTTNKGAPSLIAYVVPPSGGLRDFCAGRERAT